MGGETQYYRQLIVVVHEVIRQSLLHGDKSFQYSWFALDKDLPKDEQEKILDRLSELGHISFRHELADFHGQPLSSFEVNVNASLKEYEREIEQKLTDKNNSTGGVHRCYLRLDDVYLKLKVDDKEYTIARLQEELSPHKVFVLLSNRAPGTKVSVDEVPGVDDLWRLIDKSRLGYLKPFLKKYSDGGLSISPAVDLEETEIRAMLPHIAATYRKKIDYLQADM